MIDLHLHLDGSLTPEFILSLAQKQNISLPTYNEQELEHLLQAPNPCKDLNEYLTRFELPLKLMQTRTAVMESMKNLVCRLKEQGLLYAEIRFAPQLHTKDGMSMEAVVEAAIEGLEDCCWGNPVKPGLILCLMRGAENKQENMQTVRIAKKYLNRGVVAVDLAGAEAIYKTKQFATPFQLAVELSVPFTIHAGEADGADSIREAVKFGATRIGHGIHITQDEQLLEWVTEKKILLEMCPTSNLQTGAVPSLSAHPIAKLLRKGTAVCINTDNMTVSNTTIQKEFDLVRYAFDLTKQERKQLLINAVQGAFISGPKKNILLQELDSKENEI